MTLFEEETSGPCSPYAERAQEVADALLGTADPLLDHVTDEEEVDVDFCEELDARVAQCECCGWWVSADDVNDEYQCQECEDEAEA